MARLARGTRHLHAWHEARHQPIAQRQHATLGQEDVSIALVWSVRVSCELWPAPRADCRALWPAAVRTAAAKGWQHAMGKKAAGKDKQRPAITIPACSGLPEAATELQMAGGTGCWA